MEKGKLRQNH